MSDCTPTKRVHIGASIGVVAVQSDEQRCAAEILRAADAAMYQAKTTGGTTCHYSEIAAAPARRRQPSRRAVVPVQT